MESGCSGESNSLLSNIEVGVEGFDEGVSDDEGLSELRGEVKAQNTNNADIFSTLVHLQDPIFCLKTVLISTDDEIKRRKGGQFRAVDLFLVAASESFGHIFNNLFGSNDNGCSGIDNTQKFSSFVAGSIEDDVVHVDSPVSLHRQIVVFEISGVVFAVDSSKDEG